MAQNKVEWNVFVMDTNDDVEAKSNDPTLGVPDESIDFIGVTFRNLAKRDSASFYWTRWDTAE